MANIRSRLSVSEELLEGEPYLRSVLSISEISLGGIPNIRSSLSIIETAYGAFPNLRSRLLIIETLQEILEEEMSSIVFPGIDPSTGVTAVLTGLAFDVHKKPMFSNKVVTHTSGKETATSYYENPKWEYTITYDYLPDVPKNVGFSDLQLLMGFFLNSRGRFDTFLFNDPDDYVVTQGFQKDFDGTSLEFKLLRSMGGFYEPVGQLNMDIALSVWLAVTETSAIPATGPYTITVTHAAVYTQTDSVTIAGTPAIEVPSAPAAGHYSVAAGVYTFNSADHGKTAVIRYRYLVDPANYTITLPNVVTFSSAPPDAATAYASFQFYFVCRFIDDVSDYRKFMDKLWDLSELGFRSVPQ